jgi:YLP motif-containing protein 1
LHVRKGQEQSDGFPFGPGFGPRFGPRMGPSFGPRFGPRGRFGPFGEEPEPEPAKTYPAIERVRYVVKEDNADRAVIKKTYEFRTLDDDTSPYLLAQGSGEIVFDKELGMPGSLDYRGTVVAIANDERVRIPLNASFQLRDPNEVAEERRQAELKAKELLAKKEADATIPDRDRVAALIQQLESKREREVLAPLKELQGLAVVPELRTRMVAALRRIVSGGENFQRMEAMKVLALWASEAEVPLLIQLITSDSGDGHWGKPELIKTLAKFPTPEACRAIASRLSHAFEDGAAQEALIQIGASAEDAVIEVLLNPQGERRGPTSARRNAAEILEKIGTQKCIEPLGKAMLDERDRWARSSLGEARDAVLARTNGQ